MNGALQALRESVAVTRAHHVVALRLSGPGALDVLEAAATSRLFVREGQLLQTLFLDQRGGIFADVAVALDEDSWVVFSEGPGSAELRAHLLSVRDELAAAAEFTMVDLTDEHQLWSLDGPYAWELTTALLGPQVLGAPYLSFLKVGEVTCFRLGKTGEYGYLLMVPTSEAAARWEELCKLGESFGLVEADLAALDACALENWHFFMRSLKAGGAELSPLELQLQWRVDPERPFRGSAAYRERSRRGPVRRLTCFTAGELVLAGEVVQLDGRGVGTVLTAGPSEARGDVVGWALIDVRLAWPGISRFCVASGGKSVAIETRSPPLLDNRSLFIDPHRHRYAERETQSFPPLVAR